VTGLVEGGPFLLLLAHHDAPLGAEHDLLEGVGEVVQHDRSCVATGGHQGGLVDEVLEVGAHHARGGRGDGVEVDVVAQRHVAGVDFEDPAPT
jgi:hypothetical protein